MALDTRSVAREEIAKIYIAAFNRVPDSGGLDNWLNQYEAGLMTYQQISEAFTSQPEYTAKYPAILTNSEYVSKIYLNVFGRAADAGGLTNWTNQLDGGIYTKGSIMNAMLEVAGEAGNTDGMRLTNQAKFGVQSILDSVPTDTATAQLANITDDAATVATATAAVAVAANPGQTFTLKTGVDTFTGTENNDSFVATNTTLTVLDNIDGAAGIDTLVITDDSNSAFTLPVTTTTIKGIENITLNHSSDDNGATDGITMDVSTLSDVRSITIVNTASANDADVSVTTKSNVTSVTIDGLATTGVEDVSITDSGTNTTASASTTDKLETVTLRGVAGTGTIASEALTTLNLNAVAGVVTNNDSSTLDDRTLTVNFDGGTNGGVTDGGAKALNVNSTAAVANMGTVTAAEALTVNYTANGAITAGTITTVKAKTINVTANAKITATTLGANTTTALNLAGAADMTLT